MSATFASHLGALVSLAPLLALSLRPRESRDAAFWICVACAVVGPCAWTAIQLMHGWNTGFSLALWVTISITMLLFVIVAGVTQAGWRLGILLGPYLFILAAFAVIWETAPARPFLDSAPAGWIRLHIVVSVLAYGLLTLASVAGLAVFLQERALKRKYRGPFTAALPSVADGEALQLRMLWMSAAGLAVGVVSGMATEYFEIGRILRLDHKTVLSLLTIAVILALLVLHGRTGMRGRRAARLVLLAYLLLTLAYPGVKFVTDILMA